MTETLKTAVILAAGMGIRLDRVGEHLPKGLTRVDDTPIVELSVRRLLREGITDIVIVTGHHANYYRQLQQKYAHRIRLVHTEDYQNSGSMYSLFQAREAVFGDFLLLESDIIYEQRALTSLMRHPAKDVVLCSGETGSFDAIFVSGREGRLRQMSKNTAELEDPVFGELVGFSKISAELLKHMQHPAAAFFRQCLQMAYETDCLVAAASHHPIPCHRQSDLLWC